MPIRRIRELHNHYDARYPKQVQFVRYLFVGGSTALLELLLFLGLLELGVWYAIANIVAFITAVIYGFVMQKRFTFRDQSTQHHVQAAKFLIVIGFGFILTNALIYLFIDIWHWHPAIAKIVQLWIVMLSNYIGHRLFTFRTRSV